MVESISGLSAAEIIRRLDLHPHPEGGHFRESIQYKMHGAPRSQR
jgi:uncharacterized protein